MAKRFGGKYSPQGTDPAQTESAPVRSGFRGAQVDPAGARSNFMFFPPVVLVFFAFFAGGASSLVLGLVGAGVLTLGAWLLREGLRAEAAYHDRKVARRPAFPRKIAAALLACIGTGLAALTHQTALIEAVLYAVAAGGLHLVAFGIDPLQNKGLEGVDQFQQDRVARVVDEAEEHLRAMSDALKRAGDRQMEARLEAFQTTARDLIRTVEEDPRDLTAARKYLGVYLLGAREATATFADIYARTQNQKARSDYAALLEDLDKNFAARTAKSLLDDRSDLNVEIEVLRERLQREGIRPE